MKYRPLEKNQRFSMLRVLEEIPPGAVKKGWKNKAYFVKCVCDCGKTTVVSKSGLTSGNTKSCGCLKSSSFSLVSRQYHSRPLGEAALQYLYTNYRCGAAAKKKPFSLTMDQFRILTSSNCFYCDKPPSQSVAGRSKRLFNGDYIYNGVDRIDSSQGYVPSNVCTCCKECNRRKLASRVEDFFSWIKRVHSHLATSGFPFPLGILSKNPSEEPVTSLRPKDKIVLADSSSQ